MGREEGGRMSRWMKMFGSPTDAAWTIMDKGLLYDLLDQCDRCPKYTDECLEPHGVYCAMESLDAIVEWLEGDAE